ncbi:MAG: hypothetical protein ACREJC_23170, partial [Tepidisphaeraceae bacterium]
IGDTQAGRSAVEVFAGRGAKIVPTINWQVNNNFVQATMQLTIPANKQVAFMHLYTTAAGADAGGQFVTSLKEAKLLADVSPELRRSIVNFSSGAGYIGDREILRGDILDVVELRGGDQMKGTIKDPSLKLTTIYGPVEIQTQRVIGMLNVGQFRPRQLVVTVDGEIFGGNLDHDTIDLILSSGQTTAVPLSQISRIGWRKRADEPEDGQFPDKPCAMLRSGDRVCVTPPIPDLDVLTRYGLLKLRPEAVAAIAFQSEEHGVHDVFLTDGSHFAGLVVGDHFDFKLAAGQSVSFPASTMSRLQLTAKIAETEDSSPTLDLANGDQLIGALVGQLKLDTAFDKITVSAPEIRTLAHLKDTGLDVQLELWDGTKLSGQFEDPELSVALVSGLTIKVPVGLIEQYDQPQPQPSAMMIERIKALAVELAADDWKQRERAEEQLVAMGPVVVGVLRQLSGTVPPEAQQRIESIIKQVEKKRAKPAAGASTPASED